MVAKGAPVNPTDQDTKLIELPVDSFAEGGRVLLRLLAPLLVAHKLLKYESELQRLHRTYRDKEFLALVMKLIEKGRGKDVTLGNWEGSVAALVAFRQVGVLREYCASDAYASELASYLVRG